MKLVSRGNLIMMAAFRLAHMHGINAPTKYDIKNFLQSEGLAEKTSNGISLIGDEIVIRALNECPIENCNCNDGRMTI